MKKFLTILVVLTAVCGAVKANEIDNPKASVGMAVMNTGSVFKIFYKGSSSGDIRVTIYNSAGDKVYKETIRKIESFVRPYNFSALPEGEYTIALDGQDGKHFQKVTYRKGTIEKLMNLVHLTNSNNKYILTVANKGPEKLAVKIFNEEDQLIYSGTEEIDGDFAKIYNLEKAGNKFLFEVTDQHGHSKTLTNNFK